MGLQDPDGGIEAEEQEVANSSTEIEMVTEGDALHRAHTAATRNRHRGITRTAHTPRAHGARAA